jgi:hypothetical protein
MGQTMKAASIKEIVRIATQAGVKRVNFGTPEKPEILFIASEANFLAFVRLIDGDKT